MKIKSQNKVEEQHEEFLKHKTMKTSIQEGSASSVMSGLGDSYISPFAIALKANNFQIGLLSSFIGLLSPLSQLFGNKLMEKYPRKRIIVTGVFLHALMWFPILCLSFLFMRNLFTEHLTTLLIILYSIYAIIGGIAGPAWFSLLGDIVPAEKRGAYFGLRSKICGAIALITMLAGAFVLDFYKTKGYALLVFSCFFFVAGIARLISSYLFTKHYDPKFKLEKGYYFSFFSFIKKAPSNNFGKFTLYSALFYFAVQIAGPFFTVYMLKDLNFSYITFTLINASASLFTLVTIKAWGKFSDKYGNREILRVGSILVALMPILWIFSKNPIYLIFVPQLVSGIGWAAFNLSTSNFIYDSVTSQRRGLCVAYFNLTVGIAIFVGAAFGGFLAQNLTINFMNKLLFIFLLSGILRFIAIFLIIPKIKEVRQKVKAPKSSIFLYFLDMHPLRETFHDIIGILGNFSRKKRAMLGAV